MSGHNTPATLGTVLPIIIGYTAIGKALVKKGILSNQDITDQLADFKQAVTDTTVLAEIDNLIKQIGSW